MKKGTGKKIGIRRWIIIFAIIVGGLAAVFLIYVSDYYHAEPEAYEALLSDEKTTVGKTDYGWFFDGPSEDELLVFYPGGKVEAAAYAPFLHLLAENGMDACLVEMPFNLAVFGRNKAGGILEQYDHENCWIGGHSLGGVMAASYAAANGESLKGVILCAAYPNQELPDDLIGITIYGSEDRVLNPGKLEEGKQYAPAENYIFEIAGGNHAFFGSYGTQAGDGPAQITPEEQQAETVRLILNTV